MCVCVSVCVCVCVQMGSATASAEGEKKKIQEKKLKTVQALIQSGAWFDASMDDLPQVHPMSL
jgi:hypothetical protein